VSHVSTPDATTTDPAARPLAIAIVGAGGVGGLLGARLLRAGHRVGFVVRSERVRALRESGLRISAPDAAWSVEAVEATDRPEELGTRDVVLLATKMYDLEASARAAAPMIGSQSIVVTLQNGVDAEAIARRALPAANVLPGIVYVASTKLASGEIKQTSRFLRVAFGAMDGEPGPMAARLDGACRAAGVDCTLARDLRVRLWTKFLFIASVAAVTCTTNQRLGAIRRDAAALASLERAMREVEAVARAHGVALAGDVVATAWKTFESLPPDATSSMHEDRLAGRPLELEFLSGAVVRLGRERGVATPFHQSVCEQLG
jgi:2-dehydropantoate 2-reductase